jgi:hypothetical protein
MKDRGGLMRFRINAMKSHPISRIDRLMPVANIVMAAAEGTARIAHKTWKEHTRRRRGATLRPGFATPLWNELARTVRRHLTRYGDQARLARLLGLHRQTVHRYLTARTAGPDAERTLLLLWWLQSESRSEPAQGTRGGTGSVSQ